MKKMIIAAIALLSPAMAHAGCANFEDDLANAPSFLACYGAECDVTVQTYVCANVSSHQSGYAIGWSVDCRLTGESEQDCAYFWQGRKIDPAKYDLITFSPLD